ncbi:hypothetical protein [Dysgonomonas sp. 520]|uniref:hypothetical protein n=1 Tax=Dysgonomonas sp. 520 TaxID=2302931 RepID=UPI0013D316E1|nr:hypothetical protein [Dysgonomonas sp. 520]
MKKLLFLLMFASAVAFAQNNNQSIFIKDPAYMGLNGKFSTLQITHYDGSKGTKANPFGKISSVEVYTFNTNGKLLERRSYPNQLKKVLMERDTYKRDKDGRVMEIYKGFNLNDKHYASESTWRRISVNGNKEKWQQIGDDWWGTSYKDVEYSDGKKIIKEYVIQKKNGQESNQAYITETLNDRNQVIRSLKKTSSKTDPINTTIWTYDENGQLLKEELEQLHKDGASNKTETESYTVDKVDNKNNPTQITDSQGRKRVYKYTYQQ